MSLNPTRLDRPSEPESLLEAAAISASERRKRKSTTRDALEDRSPRGFFAVNCHLWKMACDLGMNSAIAYLVAARGTASDMRTTPWSAEAMRKRTSLPWSLCKVAFERLLKAGLLQSINDVGKRPKYILSSLDEVLELNPALISGKEIGTAINQERQLLSSMPLEGEETDPDWIWLPNPIVDGVAGETTPLELLRQSGNLIALRLFIDLYHAQSLADFGGVDWRQVRQSLRTQNGR